MEIAAECSMHRTLPGEARIVGMNAADTEVDRDGANLDEKTPGTLLPASRRRFHLGDRCVDWNG